MAYCIYNGLFLWIPLFSQTSLPGQNRCLWTWSRTEMSGTRRLSVQAKETPSCSSSFMCVILTQHEQYGTTFVGSHCSKIVVFWVCSRITNFTNNSPSLKLIFPQLATKFPICYRNRKFITIFTRASSLSLFWARWAQSTRSQSIF